MSRTNLLRFYRMPLVVPLGEARLVASSIGGSREGA